MVLATIGRADVERVEGPKISEAEMEAGVVGGAEVEVGIVIEVGERRALRCSAGAAPVSFESGRINRVRFRRACQQALSPSVQVWANLSRATCPWAEGDSRTRRAEVQTHGGLRCPGQRRVKILWKMWRTHRPYGAELHQRNQVNRGSWVIALPTVTAETPTRGDAMLDVEEPAVKSVREPVDEKQKEELGSV